VTPADQTVQNLQAFTGAIQDGVRRAAAGGIVILGIKPTSAETGYGYIKKAGAQGPYDEFAVEQFVEKPDAQTAKSYVDNGNYFWNSGMFVLRASTWLAALKEFRYDIFGATETAWISRAVDQSGDTEFIRPDKEIFKSIPSESIDYAVIEKCPSSKFQVKMVELNAGWNDLGAWDAVWQVGQKDKNQNVTYGDTLLENTTNSLIYANHKLVSAVGVDNLVVIETSDAIMVADKNQSQHVKVIVDKLHSQKREEQILHRKVLRPWGWYDTIDQGENFKVKRIRVNPGASLSLQKHTKRAEHWVVIKGIAEVMCHDKKITLRENESTYIPLGHKHRLSNPGKEILEIIEVQSGSYLSEDDIERFDDDYGRS
jgi:mannose-1-phosphate guanylyltransferase/mannose-6-phosphate isomerase